MRHLVPLLLLLLCGCASSPDELESRVIEMQLRLSRLEARLDALADHGQRLTALEHALAAPTPDETLEQRLTDLEARVVALETPDDRGGTPAQAGKSPQNPQVIELGPAPPGMERTAPEAGRPVKVVAAGSGGLLLVDAGGKLTRIQLLGVLVPQRSEEYERTPGLRERFQDALGEQRVHDDAAFLASQAQLEGLLKGATVSLEYPEGGGRRSTSGAVSAYVVAQRDGEQVDVNAAMLEQGYGLAAPGNPRYKAYAKLEREARRAGRGLFAKQ